MSNRNLVLPKVAWWLSAFGEDDGIKAGAEAELRAAEAVIRAARRVDGVSTMTEPCDDALRSALARLDKVTGRAKR